MNELIITAAQKGGRKGGSDHCLVLLLASFPEIGWGRGSGQNRWSRRQAVLETLEAFETGAGEGVPYPLNAERSPGLLASRQQKECP